MTIATLCGVCLLAQPAGTFGTLEKDRKEEATKRRGSPRCRCGQRYPDSRCHDTDTAEVAQEAVGIRTAGGRAAGVVLVGGLMLVYVMPKMLRVCSPLLM